MMDKNLEQAYVNAQISLIESFIRWLGEIDSGESDTDEALGFYKDLLAVIKELT
jgi:hypothetical protein